MSLTTLLVWVAGADARFLTEGMSGLEDTALAGAMLGALLWCGGQLLISFVAWCVARPVRVRSHLWTRAARAPGRGVRCPVCGVGPDGEWMVCPDCETPHHQDCLEYNSGCARYGCPSAPPRGLIT